MRIRDSFQLSLNSILHRRLRSWLTLLGIIIGVAAVVAIVSIGEGAQASVNARLSGFGADIITVTAGFNRAGGFFGNFRGGGGAGFGEQNGSASSTKTPELTEKDIQVLRGNSQVSAVNQIVSGRAPLIFLSQQTNVSVQGVNPLAWRLINTTVELAAGRFLTPSDSSAVVIGDRIANSTFKQPITLGRPITINGKAFTVVGILKSAGQSFGSGNLDGAVLMHYSRAWDVTDVNKDTYSSLQVKVSDPNQIDTIVANLTSTLMISRKVTASNQDFSIESAKAIQQQVSSVTQTLTLFLGAIAAVSLIVGAIGVANSMFTSVLEKTREIGIMKALGSTNGEVLRLFVIESALFGLIGGVIGALLGTLGSYGFSLVGLRLFGMGGNTSNAVVSPELFLIAILLSTVIGILAGVVPARAASRLNPIEALRYE